MPEDEPLSPEDAAMQQARIAATEVINGFMHQGLLRTYEQLLLKRESTERHRFAPMIEWAMKLIDEDALLDKMAVSRATLKRWAAGETAPQPLARVSVMNRVLQLVEERLAR